MIMIGDKKELITLMRGHRSKWYRLACFGSAKHYRADGTCKHTDEVMISLKPGIKVRTKIDGWGGKKPSNGQLEGPLGAARHEREQER